MDSFCQTLAEIGYAGKLGGKLSAKIYGPMGGREEPPGKAPKLAKVSCTPLRPIQK